MKSEGTRKFVPKLTLLFDILHGTGESGIEYFSNPVTSMQDKNPYYCLWILWVQSWFIKGTIDFLPRVDSLVPLMNHDLSDLGFICLVKKSNQFFLFKSLILAFAKNELCVYVFNDCGLSSWSVRFQAFLDRK